MAGRWAPALLFALVRAAVAGTPPQPDTSATTVPAAVAAAGEFHFQPGVPLGFADLRRDRERLVFAPGEMRRPLGHRFVEIASEVVREGDSALVRNRNYGIDYGRGVVYLLAPAAAPRLLDISYLRLPGPRQRSFRAAVIVSRDTALAAGRAAPAAAAVGSAVDAGGGGARDLTLPATLQLSGSKSVGLSFGRNREATIDQSLHVQLAGDLAEDLHVNAVLADDNLPVRPEGNTEELGDLSKVFLEMQGPVVGGVLGDFAVAQPEAEFVGFQRELRGGEARLRLGGQSLAVGAGFAKGELVTRSFRGVEGKQGPYELLSARRLDFAAILPGTERVYLDGALLRRGDNQDYVVDYDRGELRFTSRRRISADSEIGVDFQASNERYRRDTRLARLQGGRGGLRWQGLLFEEGDAGDKPVGGALTPEDVAALSAAGDRAAIAPGIRVVGAGQGLYRRDRSDSTVVVYDAQRGDLEVSFYEVASGRGDYEDKLDALSGRRYFEYVGAGRGSFAIGRLLAPPSRAGLATGRVEAAPWRGAHLVGEASLSTFDANTFSSRDEGNDRGEALDLGLDAGERALGGSGRIGLTLHLSQLSSPFHFPGRGRPAFYYKEWNAERDSLRGLERLGETTVRYALGGERPWLRLGANVGRLDRGAFLRTDRGQLDVGVGSAERGLEARVQRLDTRRDELGPQAGRRRHFARGEGRYRFGFLVPEVHFESDEFVRSDLDSLARSSFRYLDRRYRLGLRAGGRTTAGFEFGRRDTELRRGGGWQPERRNDTFGLDVLGRPTPALGLEVALSRRSNLPRGAASESETRSDLARAVLSWSPPQASARSELRYQVSDDAVRTLQEVLVLAPDGKGDYDAEGRAVGKDQGQYDKVFRFSGEAERVQQIESSLRLELGGLGSRFGAQDSGGVWWRRNVSLVQLVSVKEQTRNPRRRDLYLLVPSAFQTDQTMFGSFQARQDWSFLNASRRHALKLFLSWEKELDGRFIGARLESRRGQATLRYDRSGSERWTLGGEAGLGRRWRSGPLSAALPGRPGADSYRVALTRLLGRVAYRLSASERLGVDVEWTAENDRLSAVRQQLLSVGPTATLAPLTNLRLFATVAATRVFEDKPPEALPPYFFDAPGTKTVASLTGNYRLGQNLNLNVTYSGVRNTDGRSTYDVKAETRAIF